MAAVVLDIAEAAKRHHLLSRGDLERLCSQSHQGRGLVAGFIGHRSVSVLIGDSGLGKSPLAYQLGLCVAEGIPFLDLKTEPGCVVYVDYENGHEGILVLQQRLTRFLSLPKTPDTFLVWSPDTPGVGNLRIEELCQDVKPVLLIVDSLRSHDPSFEKADNAGDRVNSLRSIAARTGTALLAIHHVRKPGPEGPPTLDGDDTVLMQWLNQASGHRAIINQSDSRVAADYPKRGRGGEMVLRWHRRIHGEGGPLYLERVCDDEGNPIGYRRLTGAALLENPDQRAAYERLPGNFTFKDAKLIFGRSDDPTHKWLLRCENLGLVRKVERGVYHRVAVADSVVARPVDSVESVEELSVR